MRESSAQLDLFSVVDAPPIAPQISQTTELEIVEEVEMSTCFRPSASIRECRECWEKHPELWARYYTRANCVKHTR